MKKNILVNNSAVEIDVVKSTQEEVEFLLEGKKYQFSKNMINDKVVSSSPSYIVNGLEIVVETVGSSRSKKAHTDHGQMIAPMPGKILKILISEGATIVAGTPILVMEAMKMEHTVKASKDGVVSKIHFKEGSQVSAGVELVSIC